MSYYYTNEIVFRGHPDKVCDQISDALLDAYLAQDNKSRCGIETVGGKGKIFITGEVTSKANVDVERVVKSVLKDVGYSTNYEIIDNIGKQSPDIAQGVDIGGAGDQGMMFGYACRDTPNYIPKSMEILQKLAMYYDVLSKGDNGFLPDGKAQITGRYSDNGELEEIIDFVISYQNTEKDRNETDEILRDFCKRLCNQYKVRAQDFYFNPTGKFEIGGFDGDAGLTGRKLLIDNYHSFSAVGGGAFSGKDCTKVDRSAAYKAREIAINFLKYHPNVKSCIVQLSYAIGMDIPLAIFIRDNNGKHYSLYDSLKNECTPSAIIKHLQLNDLKAIKYYETAQFGHFGNPVFPWEVR